LVGDIEAELEAIKTLQLTLEPLAPEVRARVLDYVFRVLAIAGPPPMPALGGAQAAHPVAAAAGASGATTGHSHQSAHTDILSLKMQKQPTSANQMIALVAYYLAHEAPEDERKNSINADDVKKYFVQGRYPLPSSPGMALTHARNAGYLDPVDRGTYRLNSVGYNLVAHKLVGEAASTAPKAKHSNRKAKKGVKR
jgi:hypothetical protein